jgi:hypothetical protein
MRPVSAGKPPRSPDADGRGKEPNDQDSGQLYKPLSLNDLGLIQAPFGSVNEKCHILPAVGADRAIQSGRGLLHSKTFGSTRTLATTLAFWSAAVLCRFGSQVHRYFETAPRPVIFPRPLRVNQLRRRAV